MEVTLYSFEDAEGNEPTCWTTFKADEAHEHAREHGYKLIANNFEYTDCETVADYTPRSAADDHSADCDCAACWNVIED